MRAIRQHAFGGPEELHIEVIPDPHPGEGQVRIRVESAGVHLLDAVIRAGQLRLGEAGIRQGPSLPMTPGREVAGVVDAVGAGGDEGLLGRRVVADLGLASGGYAALAIADVSALHLLPDDLDADQAVAMVGTGRATMAILELAAPTAADVILLTAAAGGIGSLLVQAAMSTGATVVGAAGGETKTAQVRQLGASHAIDYSRADWSDHVREALDGRPITLALDGVGGDIGRAALELVGVGGRLVMFGLSSGALTELCTADLYERGITVSSAIGARLVRRPGGHRSLEESALKAAAEGWLSPLIGHAYRLDEAADAHRALAARTTIGKTVLRP
jgi:NADPH2:quinone reductase